MATINYGWFVKLTEIATINPNITGLAAGSSLSATMIRGDEGSTRLLGNGPSTYIDVNFAGSEVEIRRGNSSIALKANLGLNNTNPHNIEIVSGTNPTGGAPAFQFIIDDVDRGWDDAADANNSFWGINALLSNASVGANGLISNAIVKSDASTVVAEWDGNFVLNAAGDGFITRSDANANPSLADTGYELKMYDVSSTTGRHIDLPATSTWEFVSNFSLPATVTAGATFNFTAPDSFTVEAVTLGGLTLPLTFAVPPDGTADAPGMGDVAGFPRFGTQQIQLRDDTAGLTAEQDADWQPSGTYEYRTLTSDPSTTDPASICYGWTDPLVAGDQVVYDPAVFTVNVAGIITLVTTSETFTSQYFIIDDAGMQESTITQDSTGVTIPTIAIDDPGLIPVNTATQLTATTTDAATFLWEVLSAPAGATATFTDATVEDAEITVDTAGAYDLRLTGTNAAGDGSANDTITINAGVQSTLNLTINGIPDGAQSLKLWDETSDGPPVLNGEVVFSAQTAAITLNVPVGTAVSGRWLGDNPPVTGTGIYGVTE